MFFVEHHQQRLSNGGHSISPPTFVFMEYILPTTTLYLYNIAKKPKRTTACISARGLYLIILFLTYRFFDFY